MLSAAVCVCVCVCTYSVYIVFFLKKKNILSRLPLHIHEKGRRLEVKKKKVNKVNNNKANNRRRSYACEPFVVYGIPKKPLLPRSVVIYRADNCHRN